MSVAILIADLSYLLFAFLVLAVFLLVVESLLHGIPGSALNPIRRALFQLCYPALKFSDRYLSFQWGGFRSRGLLTALVALLTGSVGLAWLVYLAFSLRA